MARKYTAKFCGHAYDYQESNLKENSNQPERSLSQEDTRRAPETRGCILAFWGGLRFSQVMCSVRGGRHRQSSGMYTDRSRRHTLPWLPRHNAIQAPQANPKASAGIRRSISTPPSWTTRAVSFDWVSQVGVVDR